MNNRARIVFCLATWFVSAILASGNGTEPFSSIPSEQREILSRRLGAYVEANRERKWSKLYDVVSDTGRGGANREAFVAAMESAHGTDFAQMPDLLEFKPDRTENNNNGYDIYGCGKARREGVMFNGIAVMHAVFEHNDWFITGWTFTEFPNESCKALSDPNWQPFSRLKWNRPMDEIANSKRGGVPFHVDAPH
jgi:hypothetical protein